MVAALVLLYFGALTVLAGLAAHRARLVWLARRPDPPPAPAPAAWPSLVVQLPIYDEAAVVEALLESVRRLEYPGRLTIQILDDSTDETRAVIDRAVAAAADDRVTVLRRPSRAGFKAGALAHGLAHSDAELVAIFDADFRPGPRFLVELVPTLLSAPELGMVQARWGHANRDESGLTAAQATLLDAHFAIEHRGRARGGLCFNFNGTAGVWRRAAIEAGGGWRSDTITEDLDLSYRAQLAGYRFEYRDDVVVDAELPAAWLAFRSQQARWARGSLQTARRLVPAILGARWPLERKVEALLHLGGNLGYVAMAVVAVSLPLTVWARQSLAWRVPGGVALLAALDLALFSAGTGAIAAFYVAAARRRGRGRTAIVEVPWALAVGAGLALSNGLEALRGLRPGPAEFVRTPKRGQARAARYRAPARVAGPAVELALGLVHVVAAGWGLYAGAYGVVPFFSLFGLGLASLGGHSLLEARAARPRLDRARELPQRGPAGLTEARGASRSR